jgi:glutamate synthase (NADPH/NADH) large chain
MARRRWRHVRWPLGLRGLDRNGLRPMRYALTEDGVLAVGSEAGMCPIDEIIRSRAACRPAA